MPANRKPLYINVLLALSTVLFIIGIIAPFMTVTKFYLFEDEVTILSSLTLMLAEQEYLLFAVISLFTILQPALKLLMLTLAWNRRSRSSARRKRYLHWISAHGKWSMLDVFVVAVLVVSVKLGGSIHTEVHYGLYAFALSVLLSMVVSSRITHTLT